MSGTDRRARIGRIIGAVVAQAVRDAGADGVVVAEAESPEGGLLYEWCEAAIGADRLSARPEPGRWLTAHPGNKTALLLDQVPAATLLPLGDLYASEIAALTGGAWSAPEPVLRLATLAGDVALLDAALRRWAEERRPLAEALAGLPAAAAAELGEALRLNRMARRYYGLVPKLGGRTLGIDLWE